MIRRHYEWRRYDGGIDWYDGGDTIRRWWWLTKMASGNTIRWRWWWWPQISIRQVRHRNMLHNNKEIWRNAIDKELSWLAGGDISYDKRWRCLWKEQGSTWSTSPTMNDGVSLREDGTRNIKNKSSEIREDGTRNIKNKSSCNSACLQVNISSFLASTTGGGGSKLRISMLSSISIKWYHNKSNR